MSKTDIDFQNIKKLDRDLRLSDPVIGELLELSEAQERKVKRILKREIEAWESDTAEQKEILEHWYNLSEGVIEETNWPYEGAFETHIGLIEIYLKVYHSIERRSILGSENIWYAEIEPGFDDLQDALPEIENMMNYKARAEWNIEEMLPESFSCANRDGLSGLMIPYVIDVEHVEDKVVISNEIEFLQEFPDPQELGEDYQTLLNIVQTQATEEAPLEIPIEYDKVQYEGPKAYLVERANLVTFPASARSLDKEYCRGWGQKFEIQRDEVRRKMDEGEWHEQACEDFLSKTAKRSTNYSSDYESNKETQVGISRSHQAGSHPFYELVYRMRMESKKEERKYHFVYDKEHDLLMMSKIYVYNVDILALFRIEKRANQLDGKSVVGQLEFLNEALDLNFNQRFQSREITNVPSFKAKSDLQKGPDGFDPEAEENQWRPRVIFWLRDPEAFQQFQVQPIDQSNSLQEDQNIFRIASWIMGIDVSLFSGQTPTDDPSAPGNKTSMLISMGNLRMEDPLAELRYGVEQVGTICLSHLYQFGPAQIGYNAVDVAEGKMMTKYLKKRLLRNGLKVKMQGVTVVMNSDTEFNKWIERWGVLIKEPLIAQNPKYRIEPLRRALRGGRIPGADKILPSLEEIQKQAVETQKQAITQMQAEQQMKQAAAMQAQAKQEQLKKQALLKGLSDRVRAQKLVKNLAVNSITPGGSNGSNQ